MAQRRLESLTEDDCVTLLRQGRVGRIVYQDDLGPIAIPVNYALAGRDVIMRVEGGAKRAAMEQPRIAFEVDHLEEEAHAGWSVIVRGPGREVPIEQVPELLHRMDGMFPTPWASGIHNVWLQITAEIVTGRRFGDYESVIIP